MIAFIAAIIAYEWNWFETPFSLFSAFLYTIPSIALFELLVQVTGINRFTAEIGLVGYTLLILFRNMLTGLRGIPPSAARGGSGDGTDAHARASSGSRSRWRCPPSWPASGSPP